MIVLEEWVIDDGSWLRRTCETQRHLIFNQPSTMF